MPWSTSLARNGPLGNENEENLHVAGYRGKNRQGVAA
jgi:hypothetical protein